MLAYLWHSESISTGTAFTRPKAPSPGLMKTEVMPSLAQIKKHSEAGKFDGLRSDEIARTLGRLADFVLSSASTEFAPDRPEAVRTIAGFAIATVRDVYAGVTITGLGLGPDNSLSIEEHLLSQHHTYGVCRAITVSRDKLGSPTITADILRPNGMPGNPQRNTATTHNESYLRQMLANSCLAVARIAGGRQHESLFDSAHLLSRVAHATDPHDFFYTASLSTALTEGVGERSFEQQDYFWHDAA